MISIHVQFVFQETWPAKGALFCTNVQFLGSCGSGILAKEMASTDRDGTRPTSAPYSHVELSMERETANPN